MALTIYRSNRVEVLQARLCEHIETIPLTDPFAAEVIVVPTYAMSRWLNLGFARAQGIAANIRYPQASTWAWQLAQRLLEDVPAQDPYASDLLTWRIFNQLPGLLQTRGFEPLTHYLADDRDGIKRWQLSERIADCFDRYQSYRPQMIEAWSDGKDQGWQSVLWRRVIVSAGKPHRVELMRRLRERLKNQAIEPTLPERISLFAPSRLAPIYLQLIAGLANRTEVLLFQHNPTDQYWADLVSDKEQARQRLQNPVLGDYLDDGNPLLASWGRQGQALQDMLIDLEPVTAAEIEDNLAPANDSLLASLQSSLYHLEAPRLGAVADGSLLVQQCHSPLRECQVLHDHLLDLLNRNPDLNSEDILVMVPEIDRYAPYIEAVFQPDSSHHRPTLAWNLSDVSVSDAHPLARVFLQLLALPRSRFTRSELLSLLDCAELCDCFGISESMRESIHALVEMARVRWGIDATHRRELGLPATDDNAWKQGWQRLFAGYALNSDDLWQGIAPVTETDAEASVAIGRFRQLFDRLVHWQQRLSQPATAAAWQQRLHRLIDEFLAPVRDNDEALLPLRETVMELGQSDANELGPALVSYWLQKKLQSTQQPGHLYSGGVTFCGMRPMRNIPFPVICVLGMQDGAFPRRQPLIEFDLMRDERRPGDPHKGDEDRYLMLETLLCARRSLYFSYCANSLKDNSECQPSVLLRELLDYIDSAQAADSEPVLSSRLICHEQPMQPFSARNFRAERPGYDGFWCETARILQQPRSSDAEPGWPQTPLKPGEDEAEDIDLDDMLAFFQHPLRYFFNQRLGIRLAREQRGEDDEVFALDGLERWTLGERLADDFLAGSDPDLQRYRAQGLLPHGRAADREWAQLMSGYRELLQRLEPFRQKPAAVRTIECPLDRGIVISGEVSQCFDGLGLMHYSASRGIRGRGLLSLWLQHLLLCASGQIAAGENSRLLTASSEAFAYAPLDPAAATSLLTDYARMYRQGHSRPLPVFPQTSYSWAAETGLEAATRKARQAWEGGDYEGAPPGENQDPVIRLALQSGSIEPWLDPLFQQLAAQIYTPAIEHGGELG